MNYSFNAGKIAVVLSSKSIWGFCPDAAFNQATTDAIATIKEMGAEIFILDNDDLTKKIEQQGLEKSPVGDALRFINENTQMITKDKRADVIRELKVHHGISRENTMFVLLEGALADYYKEKDIHVLCTLIPQPRNAEDKHHWDESRKMTNDIGQFIKDRSARLQLAS